MMIGDAIPQEAIIPGLDEKWGRPLGKQIANTIPKAGIQRMVSKFVRGIFYVVERQLIEPPFEIEHFIHATCNMHQALNRFGFSFDRPPGVTILRVVSVDDGTSSLFKITLWQQFTIYALVHDAGQVDAK